VKREAEGHQDILRISIDPKAKVTIGEFSRKGKSRQPEAACDHDFPPTAVLVPFGILEVAADRLTLIFGTSCETSDFIADGLELWWETNKQRFGHIQVVVIHADNSPHLKSHRTQFLRRMTALADKTGVKIRLVYDPPYHSKYNPIERCWGMLETHWNGTLLRSIETAVNWAGSMTWKGMTPVVHLLEKVYQKGVKVSQDMMKAIEKRIKRSTNLPKWDVTIEPIVG
jgi:transposase